jgi:putative tricarboxylic transport membrane protein
MPRDFWIGIATLGFATLYWLEAGKIRVSPLDGPVGASGLPNVLAYAMGALSIALILRALLAHFRPIPGEAEAVEAAPLVDRMRPHFRAIGMLALGIGYLLALPFIGYFLAIMVLLLAVSLYIGADLNLRTALVAILGAVSFHVLFVEFLHIPLPNGLLIDAVLSAGSSSGNS